MGYECIPAILFGLFLFYAVTHIGSGGMIPWIVRTTVVIIGIGLVGWGIFECYNQIEVSIE